MIINVFAIKSYQHKAIVFERGPKYVLILNGAFVVHTYSCVDYMFKDLFTYNLYYKYCRSNKDAAKSCWDGHLWNSCLHVSFFFLLSTFKNDFATDSSI